MASKHRKKGKPIDLSGYDMRTVPDLGRYTLTGIKAENAIFSRHGVNGSPKCKVACSMTKRFQGCPFKESDLRGSSFVGAKNDLSQSGGSQFVTPVLSEDRKSGRFDRCGSETDLTECKSFGFQKM